MIRRAAIAALTLALASGCEDPSGGGDDSATDASDSSMPTSSTGMGTDDAATSDDDDGTGSSTSEGSGECGSGFRCVDAAPAGWLGPVARHRATGGDAPPDCGGGYPEPGLTLLEGFNAPGPAECDCSCSINLASACSITVYVDLDTATCQDFSNFVMMAGECTMYDIPLGSVYGTMFASGTASCMPDAPEDVPDVEWDAEVHTCGGATVGDTCGSGDGVCTATAPDGYEPELCVFAQGDNECPTDGAYTERVVLYSAINDTRGCSECECGNAPPISCTGTFEVFADDDCSGSLLSSAAPNTCGGQVTDAGSIHVNIDQDPTCSVVAEPEPEGTAEPAGTFTFCCQPT